MVELNSLLQGFAVVLTPMNIALMFVGITLGVLIGVLPGLGGANGVAILLPLTFTMSPTSAIVMLSRRDWPAVISRFCYSCRLTPSGGLATGPGRPGRNPGECRPPRRWRRSRQPPGTGDQHRL